jgi:hypothetical protein
MVSVALHRTQIFMSMSSILVRRAYRFDGFGFLRNSLESIPDGDLDRNLCAISASVNDLERHLQVSRGRGGADVNIQTGRMGFNADGHDRIIQAVTLKKNTAETSHSEAVGAATRSAGRCTQRWIVFWAAS